MIYWLFWDRESKLQLTSKPFVKCLQLRRYIVRISHFSHFFVRKPHYNSFISQINIWNHRTEGAEKLAKYVKESMGIEVQVFTDVQSCVEMADVIIAATFATEPILKEYPMRPWVHINCKDIELLYYLNYSE